MVTKGVNAVDGGYGTIGKAVVATEVEEVEFVGDGSGGRLGEGRYSSGDDEVAEVGSVVT